MNIMGQHSSYLWILQKAYDSVRRKVLHNILIEYGIPMKLIMLIKLCLNKTYGEVGTSKKFVRCVSCSE
jgi:hypothetical protein